MLPEDLCKGHCLEASPRRSSAETPRSAGRFAEKDKECAIAATLDGSILTGMRSRLYHTYVQQHHDWHHPRLSLSSPAWALAEASTSLLFVFLHLAADSVFALTMQLPSASSTCGSGPSWSIPWTIGVARSLVTTTLYKRNSSVPPYKRACSNGPPQAFIFNPFRVDLGAGMTVFDHLEDLLVGAYDDTFHSEASRTCVTDACAADATL